ncbi:hypothetical protein MIND_01212500 [Mycena indigotica]|uniref:Uncharacterized protein n=1 Tax=Mycena indigotica TaxID=2126181 RepID=A0A8H6VS15_9AGAR|nr:uncharacterized protein MIND_01212500 [Mycena indigotica]KAF7291872.1 hypothetical protein MIND_01212500 [Mycena indigotica]
MALPWGAQAAHHKASITEGLRIVRKIVSQDATKAALTTKDIFKLATKEKPSEEFVLSVGSGKNAPWLAGNLPRPPGRSLPPGPPRPQHPIRSLSFLKHHILPIIQSDKAIRHVRETRGSYLTQGRTTSALTEKKSQSAAERKLIWLWRASRPPKVVYPRRERSAYVYDYSHMKPAKQRAHRGYHAFIAKRNALRERTAAREKAEKWEKEAPMRAEMKKESRARHLAEVAAGKVKRAERKRRWEAQNPVLAQAVARKTMLEERAKAKGRSTPEKNAKPLRIKQTV